MPRSPYQQVRIKILFEHLEKYKDSPSHTLARILFRDHPDFFRSHEDARSAVRKYRGATGDNHRKLTRETKYYRNV